MYFYMNTCPSFKFAKFPTLRPTFDVFRDMKIRDMKQIHEAERSAVGKVQISADLKLTRATIDQKFKAANPTGNQKSAAATAWLLANQEARFIKAPMAWAGGRPHGLEIRVFFRPRWTHCCCANCT